MRDIQGFVDHIGTTYDFAIRDIAVIAQSVGAVLAATWVHDYAPAIRCQVLASPAFKVKLYVPLAVPGLRLMHAIRGNFFVNSYVKAKLLTRDPDRITSFEDDPLIARAISVNILLQLYDAGNRVVADAGAITTPTQLLISGNDWVVHHKPQHRFYEHLGSAFKERHVFDGFFHDTLGERDRADALAKIRRFIKRAFDEPGAAPSLLNADERGYTRSELDRLQTPLPTFSPRGLFWSGTRAGLRLGGHLSQGIRLGHETGFDSGVRSIMSIAINRLGVTASAAGLIAPIWNRSDGAASVSASCISNRLSGMRWLASMLPIARFVFWISPQGTVATCWMRSTTRRFLRPPCSCVISIRAMSKPGGRSFRIKACQTSRVSRRVTPSTNPASRRPIPNLRWPSSRASTSCSPITVCCSDRSPVCIRRSNPAVI